MKVILLKDTPKVGRRFEIKEVSDGYAVNFLLPRGFAEKATPEKLVELDKKVKEGQTDTQMRAELLRKQLETLKESGVSIARPTNDEGHLFAGIKVADIAKATNIPETFIILEQPIKTIGEHKVLIQSGDIKASIKINISAQ